MLQKRHEYSKWLFSDNNPTTEISEILKIKRAVRSAS